MFEAQVLQLLRKYLGQYVVGLDDKALSISVLAGDVVLKNLSLKKEALNALKLPITVKAGFLGSVRLSVPWSRLGREPVIVRLDRIFILAEPNKAPEAAQTEEELEALIQRKLRRVEDAEVAWLNSKSKQHGEVPDPNSVQKVSWITSLVSTVVANLQLSITNVHIRYEDTESNPGHPFAMGVTLEKLSAVTVDEAGSETFVQNTTGAARKKAELSRLAAYVDSERRPWRLRKAWGDLTPEDWSELFLPRVTGQKTGAISVLETVEETGFEDMTLATKVAKQVSTEHGETAVAAALQHESHYLLLPVAATMLYRRSPSSQKPNVSDAKNQAKLRFDQVALSLSKEQYRDIFKLVDMIATYSQRSQFVDIHPMHSVKGNAPAWWRFSAHAVLRQTGYARRDVSWEKIEEFVMYRKKYVDLYAAHLSTSTSAKSSKPAELLELDRILDYDVIVIFRGLAHFRTEATKIREPQKSSGWWPWGHSKRQEDTKPAPLPIEGLSEQDWVKVNELIEYHPEEADPKALQVDLTVEVHRAAMQLLAEDQVQVLFADVEELFFGLRLYPSTVGVHVKTASYGVLTPSGELVKAGQRVGYDAVVDVTYVHKPFDIEADGMVSATLAPLYVKIERQQLDSMLEFFKRAGEDKHLVKLQASAALQLEEARKNAVESLQTALKEQKRFVVHLDISAPKIAVPLNDSAPGTPATRLFLDLGHFRLDSEPAVELGLSPSEADMYECFKLQGSEICGFFCRSSAADDELWAELPTLTQLVSDETSRSDIDKQAPRDTWELLPVLGRCGMVLRLGLLRMQQPQLASVRLDVQLPCVRFHFSPVRYKHIMQVVNVILNTSTEDGQDVDSPSSRLWETSEFSGQLRMLTWGGLGSRNTIWQSRWAILSGPYLYLLSKQDAPTYLEYISLIGKYVFPVPPERVAGCQNVVAIWNSKDVSKVAESRSAFLLQLDDDHSRSAWLRHLTRLQDERKAERLPSFMHASNSDAALQFSSGYNPATRTSFALTGSLDELTLNVSGSAGEGSETPLAQLTASGGKITLGVRPQDLVLSAAVRSLLIEDLFHGHVAPTCRYLACSVRPDILFVRASIPQDTGIDEPLHMQGGDMENEDEDEFFDASDEAMEQSTPRTRSMRRSHSGRASANLPASQSTKQLASTVQEDGRLLEAFGDIFKSNGAEVAEDSDLVNLAYDKKNTQSPDYEGIDSSLVMNFGSIFLFCNPPTIAALIAMGLDISDSGDFVEEGGIENAEQAKRKPEAANQAEHQSPAGSVWGSGKSRTVFRLLLSMESAVIFLNKDDGAPETMGEMNKLGLDLRVFPTTMSVQTTLGNLRLCDLGVPSSHPHRWLCDLREDLESSFVDVAFTTFREGESDYAGYESHLSAKLSSVRIVFLYRFIQDITEYVQFLVPAHSIDAATAAIAESAAEVARMQGAAAIKLDISLATPLILVPRSTDSTESMELDLGKLEVANQFEWRGGQKSQQLAVHIDVMHITLSGVNAVMVAGDWRGQPIIEQVAVINCTVRRVLRDLHKRLTPVEVEIELPTLLAAMSDREYRTIIQCATDNFAEPPRIQCKQAPARTASLPKDKTHHRRTSSVTASTPPEVDETYASVFGTATPTTTLPTPSTAIRVSVNISQVQLHLYNGGTRQASLGLMRVTGLWLVYLGTADKGMHIMLTLPRLCILDKREQTPIEARTILVGGVYPGDEESFTDDMEWPSPLPEKAALRSTTSAAFRSFSDVHGRPQLTTVLMEYHAEQGDQSIIARVQKPRLLVAVDFLLGTIKFFMPTVDSLPDPDAVTDHKQHDDIRLSSSAYAQPGRDETLSADRRLLADTPTLQVMEYDGKGGNLWLPQPDQASLGIPLIIVGDKQLLRFKNVHIKNASVFNSILRLGFDSRVSLRSEDGVVLEDEQPAPTATAQQVFSSHSKQAMPLKSEKPAGFSLVLQAVSPELTFVGGGEEAQSTVMTIPRQFVRAFMDINLRYSQKGTDHYVQGTVKSFTIATQQQSILDPCDLMVEMQSENLQQKAKVAVTDLCFRASIELMDVILQVIRDVQHTLVSPPTEAVAKVNHFTPIWSNEGSGQKQKISVWRPIAPWGYSPAGDCINWGYEPPSFAVNALSSTCVYTIHPVGYRRVWACVGAEDAPNYTMWAPIAPRGFLALGCIVTPGKHQPSNSLVLCIASRCCVQAPFNDCPYFEAGVCSIWRVDNCMGTFVVASAAEAFAVGFTAAAQQPPPTDAAFDLRPFSTNSPATNLNDRALELEGSVAENISDARLARYPTTIGRLQDVSPATSMRQPKSYITCARFQRIWWDKGWKHRSQTASIWRPQPPPGYRILGDCINVGHEPPSEVLVMFNDDTGKLKSPVRFELIWRDTGSSNREDLSIWLPVAPPGYATLGCIASRGPQPPSLEAVSCLRIDLVEPSQFDSNSVWEVSDKFTFSVWRVHNEPHTFIAHTKASRPSQRQALNIGGLLRPELPDTVAVDVSIGRVSIGIFDGTAGAILTPLAELSITALEARARGRPEQLTALLVTDFTMSSYNQRLTVWEPVLETTGTIIKYQYASSAADSRHMMGTMLSITTTTDMNVTIATAATDSLARISIGLQRLLLTPAASAPVDENGQPTMSTRSATTATASRRSTEDVDVDVIDEDDVEPQALEEHEELQEAGLQVENQLGMSVFVRVEHDQRGVEITEVPVSRRLVLHVPPPRLSAAFLRGMAGGVQRPPRTFIGVRILQARNLPAGSPLVRSEYICSLQILTPETPSPNSIIQTARTRAAFAKRQGTADVVQWQEEYIFEIPSGEPALSILLIDQAASQGKGVPVGEVAIPLSGPPAQQWLAAASSEAATGTRLKRKVFEAWFTLESAGPMLDNASPMPSVIGESGAGPAPTLQKYYSSLHAGSGQMELLVGLWTFTEKAGRDANVSRLEKEDSTRIWSRAQFSKTPNGPWESVQAAYDVRFSEGRKQLTFRSLVRVVNDTDVSLGVSSCPLGYPSDVYLDGTAVELEDTKREVVEEVFENQRYIPIKGWGSKGHFLPTDRKHWSWRDGSHSSEEFVEPPLPEDWSWTSEWRVETTGHVDKEGWCYASDFPKLRYPPSESARKKGILDFVRRRRWVRERRRVPSAQARWRRSSVLQVPPGDTYYLPLDLVEQGKDMCVQLRPQLDSAHLTGWGVDVTGQDSFAIASLSETHKLLECRATVGSGSGSTVGIPSDSLYLCTYVRKHPVVAMNLSEYDTEMTVHAPFSIENLLPCRAQYIIWERRKGGQTVVCQTGSVASGQTVQCYTVDIRRPVYLTFDPETWQMANDDKQVLICTPDPLTTRLPNHFHVVQRNGRKLRVCVEHDWGSELLAPKMARIYVPYWFSNESALQLGYRLTTIHQDSPSPKDGPSRFIPSKRTWRRSSTDRDPSNSLTAEELNAGPSTPSTDRPKNALQVLPGLEPQPLLFTTTHSQDLVSLQVALVDSLGLGSFSDAIVLEDEVASWQVQLADEKGHGYKLTVKLELGAEAFQRTKIVKIVASMEVSNRSGRQLYLRQYETNNELALEPSDVHTPFHWSSIHSQELLQVRMDGTNWSRPFPLGVGEEYILLRRTISGANGIAPMHVMRVQMARESSSQRMRIVFRAADVRPPYRIENRSSIPLQLRQAGVPGLQWQTIPTLSSAAFAWESLQAPRELELSGGVLDLGRATVINPSRILKNQEKQLCQGPWGPAADVNVYVSVFRDAQTTILWVEDWKPDGMLQSEPSMRLVTEQITASDKFELHLEMASFGISLVDQEPAEIVYILMEGLFISYTSAGGLEGTRTKIRLKKLQVDNQLSHTILPVMVTPILKADQNFCKFTLQTEPSNMDSRRIWTYLGINCQGDQLRVSIHEPVVWRLYEYVNKVAEDFSRNARAGFEQPSATTAASDPIIKINLLSVLERGLRANLTFITAPAHRPHGKLGVWAAVANSFGNINGLTLKVRGTTQEHLVIRQGALPNAATSAVSKQILSQALRLVRGIDVLTNVENFIGTVGHQVAQLSLDKKYIRERIIKEKNQQVDHIGDGLLQGSEAFVKSIFRGVTGVVTKPVEGAVEKGVSGFVEGMAKGVLGLGAQPVTGLLDLASKTTAGVNATISDVGGFFTNEKELERSRYPRAISGDGVLRPYNQYMALGQMMLWHAKRGTYFGQYDIFKEKGKYVDDKYEWHVDVPKNRVVLITNARVMLLSNMSLMGNERDPGSDAAAVLWDVMWGDLLATEEERYSTPTEALLLLTEHFYNSSGHRRAKTQAPAATPSRLVLHLKTRARDKRVFDKHEIMRVIKCFETPNQVPELRAKIHYALEKYGLGQATKTYDGPDLSRIGVGIAAGAVIGTLGLPLAPITIPLFATVGGIMGASSGFLHDSKGKSLQKKLKAKLRPMAYPIKRQPTRQEQQLQLEYTPGHTDVRPNAVECTQFQEVWNDRGVSNAREYSVSIWRPVCPEGYVLVGDVVRHGYQPPEKVMVYLHTDDGAFARPVDFELIWRDNGLGCDEPVTIWEPVPPAGYVAIGCVAVGAYERPSRDVVWCIRSDKTYRSALFNSPIWRDHGNTAIWRVSLWPVDGEPQAFLAVRSHAKPPDDKAYGPLL
eukprot:jgi/Chlat1/2148/Chrsp17S02730